MTRLPTSVRDAGSASTRVYPRTNPSPTRPDKSDTARLRAPTGAVAGAGDTGEVSFRMPAMHRVVIEPLEDGWLLRRPDGHREWIDSRAWAERAAESVAHEFHARSGRPACALVANDAGWTEFARFG